MAQKNENTQFRSLRSPGHLQVRRVRCGKRNCKCTRGFFHTAYYHAWDEGGVRHRKFVRRDEVEAIREFCELNRTVKIQLRAARDEQKAIHDHVRRLKRLFAR